MNDTTPTPRATTVRLDDDVRNDVEVYARRTRRTLNGAVNYLLAVGLNEATPERAVMAAPAELHTR